MHSLRFVASKASGFTNLAINDGVARVRLTGGCSSGGATFSVANEIIPTLKPFPSVHWVKNYGAAECPAGVAGLMWPAACGTSTCPQARSGRV